MRQSGRRRRRGRAKALLWFAAVCGFGLAVVVFLGREAAPGKGSVRVGAVEQAAAPELREQAGTGGAAAELQFATAAQRRAYERELFAAVRAIPAAQLEENRDGYARLLEVDPQNEYYRRKFRYYRDRVEGETQSFQEEIRDLLARPGADDEALIEALLARGVVEKTGVPGALPRLWVAPGFYELGFDSQQQVVEVFYRHYRAQDPRYDMVMVYDAGSGEMIGIFGANQGGLRLR